MIEHYEILYLISGDKTEEEVKPITESVHQLLREAGANVTKEDFWGKRKLAYPIEHQRQGYYDYVEFDLDGSKLADIERTVRLNEHILRHQVVIRIVLTPEQLAAREKLQERIAAKRQAEKDKAAVAVAIGIPAPVPEAPAEPVQALTGEELEEKLEEILDKDKLDV